MDCPVTEFPHVTTLEVGKQVEFPETVSGKVSGTIPKWMSGSWYRNGPGVLHFEKESLKHWFDGMALVRKFSINETHGTVSYKSRLIQGDSLLKNTAAGKVVVAEFGTQVKNTGQGIMNKLKSFLTLPELTDNCLINFIAIGEDLFAITEGNFMQKIDRETLETLEKVDLSQYLPINVMASHPLVDNADQSLYLFSTSIFSKGRTKYNLLRIPKANNGESYQETLSRSVVVGSLNSSWRVSPSYHHSFSMTDNYAIFMEMPMKIDIPSMGVAHLRQMSYSDCLEFLPDTKTHIFLIKKATGERHPITYKTDPLIVYHHINAYEEDGLIVMDFCGYQRNGFYDKFLLENLHLPPDQFMEKFSSDEVKVVALRLILPLEFNNSETDDLINLPGTNCIATLSLDGKIVYCSYEKLVYGTESPSINPAFLGKKYKYFYSPGGGRLPPGEKLMKIDVEAKSCCKTWKEKGCWVSQPVFVPHPEAVDEDNGVVMASVTCEGGSPFLLFLEASSFKEIARVTFDANIPPDLHGVFLPNL